MSTGILLASHGDFAKAALGSLEMIAGKQEHIIALSLHAETSLEQLEAEMTTAYQSLKEHCDVIIAICDIYGGSPFNAISRCLLHGMEMQAYTGLSLPLLIDLALSRELTKEEVHEHILSVHQQALQPIEVKLVEEQEELDL